MCSGVGVAMVAAVGAAALIRRGWRVAALHTVPLAVIFAVWWIVTQDWARYRVDQGQVNPRALASFISTGVGATFGALGQLPGIAWFLGAMLVVGLFVAWTQTEPAERRQVFALPAALLVGMAVFLVVTGIGRAHLGAARAREGRYLHVQAAMLLPVIALAADALGRRWRFLVPVALAVFVVGVPGNISAANDYAGTKPDLLPTNLMVGIARMPLSRQLPGSTEAFPSFGPKTLTIGWLLDALDSGRLPTAPSLSSVRQEQFKVLFSGLVPEDRQPDDRCQPALKPVRMRLAKHESFGTRGGEFAVRTVSPTDEGRPVSQAYAAGDHVLAAGVRPLTIEITSASADVPMRLGGAR